MNHDGMSDYKAIKMQQHPNVIDIFSKFFNEEKFSQIIEIGTGHGGFALFLTEISKKYSIKYYTFDINDEAKETFNVHQIPFQKCDVLNESSINKIAPLIQQEGKTLLLVDGGSKIKEFKAYSVFLKDGDIIMCHDYAPTLYYFKKNMDEKIWNWIEIRDYHVYPCLMRQGLCPYKRNIFLSVAWGCFIKSKQRKFLNRIRVSLIIPYLILEDFAKRYRCKNTLNIFKIKK